MARCSVRPAARIAASRPQALLYASVIQPGSGRLLAAVRTRLGRDFPIIAGDALLLPRAVFQFAGPAARGVLVTVPGVPVARLGPTGRRFVEVFGASQPGGRVTEEAVYAAQATEILPDAIARSDGTRVSVTRELFAPRVRDGLIGDLRFDRDGDVVARPLLRGTPRARLPAERTPVRRQRHRRRRLALASTVKT